ncbi:MAG: hypothetical protein O3C20_20720 [Verrucomicrobia bacterium]|nr:hypothetical protein [Verrucomicrobiota bacterium]
MKKTHVALGIAVLIVSGLISFSTLQSLISGKEKKELVAEITSAKRESEKKEGVERALLFVEELNAIDREIKNEELKENFDAYRSYFNKAVAAYKDSGKIEDLSKYDTLINIHAQWLKN